VGDLPTSKGITSFAVSRAAAVAAFRWLDTTGPAAFVDAFYATAKTKPVHVGLRILPIQTSERPSDSEESLAVKKSFVEGWRTNIGGELLPAGRRFPGFMEFAGVLAGRGQVAVTSGELLDRARNLESEVETLRLMVAEQADELQLAHRNLRSTQQTTDFEPAIEPMFAFAGAQADATQSEEMSTFTPPVTLEELPLWAMDNAERIVVLPRALKGAKKSQYQNPEHIWTALELLAGPYRLHRLGELSKPDFEAALAESGLQLDRSVVPMVAGAQGETYYVRWGRHRRFLDMHLLKGGGREPRYCMRIYFFWDSESGRCVIGDMPLHLDNSLT
jgi:hypothetical protein